MFSNSVQNNSIIIGIIRRSPLSEPQRYFGTHFKAWLRYKKVSFDYPYTFLLIEFLNILLNRSLLELWLLNNNLKVTITFYIWQRVLVRRYRANLLVINRPFSACKLVFKTEFLQHHVDLETSNVIFYSVAKIYCYQFWPFTEF